MRVVYFRNQDWRGRFYGYRLLALVGIGWPFHGECFPSDCVWIVPGTYDHG